MLIYGTRKPNDMCWYPRSHKISWRGLGVIGASRRSSTTTASPTTTARTS